MIPPPTESLQTPSDLLAVIADALVESELRRPELVGKREWITEQLLTEYRAEPWWRRSMGELRRDPAIAALHTPILPAIDVGGMITLVRAAQLLDIWHLPLVAAGALPKVEEHVQAANMLHDYGRYNESERLGALLPAVAGGGSDPLDQDRWHEPFAPIAAGTPGALWPWLDSTTYLPRRIPGQGPHDMGEAGAFANQRPIAVRLRRAKPGQTIHPFISGQPKVAIAPLVQTGAEVRFVASPDGTRYNLVPAYSEDRLAEVVRQAIEAEAELLLIPEMALRADHLPVLTDRLLAEADDHYARTGKASALAYVLAGVTAPAAGEKPGQNFLVLLNARGEEVFRQYKLSHWDIDAGQQEIFGLDVLGVSLADPVEEHTASGKVLNIRDIDGLGRIVNCICSDLNQDLPLDWLLLNARLDWLHAAIMDKSLCWVKSTARPPWAVRRAERAAVGLRGRLIVTNSVGLSDWVSETNERKKSDYGRYDAVGVALCLDSRGARIMQKLVFSKVGESEEAIVKCEPWSPEYWDHFPHPAFK